MQVLTSLYCEVFLHLLSHHDRPWHWTLLTNPSETLTLMTVQQFPDDILGVPTLKLLNLFFLKEENEQEMLRSPQTLLSSPMTDQQLVP